MSAGETDIEVDRVQFLHAATTGYAPLIFNLEPTCNDMQFIEMCQSVWNELESDPKLPKKLVIFCYDFFDNLIPVLPFNLYTLQFKVVFEKYFSVCEIVSLSVNHRR